MHHIHRFMPFHFLICTEMLSPSRRLKFKHTHMHTLSVCWAVPVSWLGLFQVPLSCNPYFPHSVKLPVFFCFEAPLIPPLRSKKPRLCNLDCELCCVTRSVCQRECKRCSLLSQSTFFSMFHTCLFFSSFQLVLQLYTCASSSFRS